MGGPPVGGRREARERALGLLYEADAKDADPRNVLAALPVAPDEFAADVVAGVAKNLEEIDGYLRRFARDWSVERMPVVDRALLRMAVFELLHRPDVPTGVIISEAVELATSYSTDDSSRFVNGLLAAIADDIRPGTQHLSDGASDSQ
jgi:N utilization substance protein B